ncbi:hypothetical protein [Rhodocaloribacter sp.]
MTRVLLLFGLSALLLGCDAEAPTTLETTARSRIVLDVGSFRTGALRSRQPCLSTFDEIGLFVTMESGEEDFFLRTLAPGASSETFDVTVELGTVNFLVEIFSNTGATLYRGERSTEIVADGFSVSIPVTPVAPVLEVCPEMLTLSPENRYSGTMEIFNKGIGTLAWTASNDDLCNNEACLFFEPDAGAVSPADSNFVSVFSGNLPDTPTTFLARIETETGFVELPVRVE